MAVWPVPMTRSGRTNRIQVVLMARLETDFPALSWLTIYKAVSAARVDAARRLPDVQAYSEALESQARDLLTVAAQQADAASYL
jgi:type II secretory pathway component PulM